GADVGADEELLGGPDAARAVLHGRIEPTRPGEQVLKIGGGTENAQTGIVTAAIVRGAEELVPVGDEIARWRGRAVEDLRVRGRRTVTLGIEPEVHEGRGRGLTLGLVEDPLRVPGRPERGTVFLDLLQFQWVA